MDDETFVKLLAEQTKSVRQTILVSRRTMQQILPRANVGVGTTGSTGEHIVDVPGMGTLYVQMQGKGSVASYKYQEGGQAYTFNQGAVLVPGAFYEFPFKVGKGAIWLVGSDEIRVFWIPE